MTIDPAFIKTLQSTQPETYHLLSNKHVAGVHFASLCHDGYPIYSPTTNDQLLELDEFESILAFDMLIANDDRRIGKPNILRGPNHYLLIDHEKAFEGLWVIYENYQKGIMPNYFKRHIFYERLNKYAKTNPNQVNFETFEEYFRNLSLKRVEENVNFLIERGFNADECNSWMHYLLKQKENYHNFVPLLKQKISE